MKCTLVPRGAPSVDHLADGIRLVAEDDFEDGNARLGGRRKRAEDERPPENGVEQLRMVRAVLEPVPVSGREHDGVPYRDRRD